MLKAQQGMETNYDGIKILGNSWFIVSLIPFLINVFLHTVYVCIYTHTHAYICIIVVIMLIFFFLILFQCLNEILESADAPLEVTDGFIQSISLSVPWGSLLQDNCALEVKGLEMVFRPRPRLGRLVIFSFLKRRLHGFSEEKGCTCFSQFLALFKVSF